MLVRLQWHKSSSQVICRGLSLPPVMNTNCRASKAAAFEALVDTKLLPFILKMLLKELPYIASVFHLLS